MNKHCVGNNNNNNNTCLKASSSRTSTTSSSSSSASSTTIVASNSSDSNAAPVAADAASFDHCYSRLSFKRKCIAFLPLLFSEASQVQISGNSLGLVTAKELEELSRAMSSKGFDRSVRQTIPTTRRKARASPRSSSVSAYASSLSSSQQRSPDSQDLIEAEREYQRQKELEKSASDLAMEAMESKFLARRKRLQARKVARESLSSTSRDKSDPSYYDERLQQFHESLVDDNGNNLMQSSRRIVGAEPAVAASPDLSLSVTTKLDLPDHPSVLFKKPEAYRAVESIKPDQSVRAKHDKQMKSYEERELNGKKRAAYSASLIRTHASDTDDDDDEPEEDSGYDAKSALTEATHRDTSSRAVSRGSLSSSVRPLSSEFEESAWGSQELLESDSSLRKRSQISRSSDEMELEHSIYQDADDLEDNVIKYGDFDVGEIETPASYEVIDLPATRIDIKADKDRDRDKSSDKATHAKELSSATATAKATQRRPRNEGRRSTSDPVRDRLSSSPSVHLPAVVRRGSTAMPYHFAMPSSPTAGYMRPTVASLRARYEREDADRIKASEEEQYRLKKAEDEFIKTKVLDEERTQRYEEWLKKLDEVNTIQQPTIDRLKKLESDLYRMKRSDESESHVARAYRRRVIDSDSELIFPISRKTQTKPDLHYQVKMVSRSCQTSDVSRSDASVNTEIDLRLMNALLDKLLAAKTTVAVQTNWKSDVVETRDVGVSTDRYFRERHISLPSSSMMRSQSTQTEASVIRSKNKSVATDPEITGHRQRIHLLRESYLNRVSSASQTDQKWLSRKDASCEALLSSYSSESSEETVLSAYPKGFHPKTGKLLDERILQPRYYQQRQASSAQHANKQYDVYQSKPVSKTPEPIIEEFGSSRSSSDVSDDEYLSSSGGNKAISEIYEKRYFSAAVPQTASKLTQTKSTNLVERRSDFTDYRYRPKDYSFKDKFPSKSDFYEHFDREPLRPDFDPKFTAENYMDSRRYETREKHSPVPEMLEEKTVPTIPVKTVETQTVDRQALTQDTETAKQPSVQTIQLPRDLKTESKIIVEVTKASKKERSEVTSFTQLDDDGRMSRTTKVTTSKHVPVSSSDSRVRNLSADRSTTPQSLSTPVRPLSPIRKARSEMNVTPVSDVSTRPASADYSSSPTTPSAQTTTGIPSANSMSSLKTPTSSKTRSTRYADEIDVPNVGRVSIEDPMHLLLLAPPDSFVSKQSGSSPLSTLRSPMIINGPQWRETSSSTVCSEMSSDAFKDEQGKAQKPKSVTMTTETLIENVGKESKIHTKSRTTRKFPTELDNNAINTSEPTVNGLLHEDTMRPQSGNLSKGNSNVYASERENQSQMYSTPHSSTSPVIQLADTPDIPDLLSPEPESILKKHRKQDKRYEHMSSLEQDVMPSRYFPDDANNVCNKLETMPQSAVVVEQPVQLKTALINESNKSMSQVNGFPGTELITRIIRTTHPDKSRKSTTVFEQELHSPDTGLNGGGGCKISSSITFDSQNDDRGVIIRELNEDGTSKHGSMDDLDEIRSPSQQIMTETNFQRFKSARISGSSGGGDETSWKYSMECHNANTTVRTNISYKRQTYPITTYETSL